MTLNESHPNNKHEGGFLPEALKSTIDTVTEPILDAISGIAAVGAFVTGFLVSPEHNDDY